MNINDFCWVRLTDEGLSVARDEIKIYGRPKGQWTRFQVWHLMAIFGPHMGMSSPQYFLGNEIVFDQPGVLEE